MAKIKILELNEYVLLQIFKFCNEYDLEHLYFTCRTFQNLIENGIYYNNSKNLLMTGHSGSITANQSRTFKKISFRDRIRISGNWTNGRYKEYIYARHQQLYGAKIILEKCALYLSHTEYIRIYKRTAKEPLQTKFIKEIRTSRSHRSDIADFVKKDEQLFGGRTCGNCFFYEDDYAIEQRLHPTNEYLTCVDFNKNTFITCTDKTSKLWTKTTEFGLNNFELIQDYKNPYKCIQMSEDGEKICGGMYTALNRRALRMIDVETGFQKILNSNTFSIYDVKLKDDNIILTANFDTTFRIFDQRTNRDESIWSDPYDSSVYCLEYDGLFGVVCGMKYHNRVNLYDIRVPNKFTQIYFPAAKKSYGSPIYSIACDNQHLFVSTDHDLRILHFIHDWAPKKDYRNIFFNMGSYQQNS